MGQYPVQAGGLDVHLLVVVLVVVAGIALIARRSGDR